jgi:hypothetical protein
MKALAACRRLAALLQTSNGLLMRMACAAGW